MDQPALSRAKKTIVRSRTGCLPCRQKRRKCDEHRPTCVRCKTHGSSCEYPAPVTYAFRDATHWAQRQVQKARGGSVASLYNAPPSPKNISAAEPQSAHPSRPGNAHVGLQKPWMGNRGPLVPALCLSDRLFDTNTSFRSLSPDCAVHNRVYTGTEYTSVTEPPGSVETSSLTNQQELPLPRQTIDPCSSFEKDLTEYAEHLVDSSPTDSLSTLEGHNFCEAGQMVQGPLLQDPSLLPTAISANGTSISNNEILHYGWDDFLSLEPGTVLGYHSSFQGSYSPGDATLAETFSPPQLPINSGLMTSGTALAQNPDKSSLPNNTAKPTLPLTVDGCDMAMDFCNPGILQPPNHDVPSTADRIYLAHFNLHVREILPVKHKALFEISMGSESARLAAMALSAANLSNLQGSYGGIRSKAASDTSRWIPKKSHAMKAAYFASKVSEACLENASLSVVETEICVQILLSLVEAELGTVKGLRLHVNKLEDIFLRHSEQVACSSNLLALWWNAVQVRSTYRSMGGPHNRLHFEDYKQRRLMCLSTTFPPNSSQISMVASTAVNIYFRIILCRTMRLGADYSEDLVENISEWYSIMQGVSHLPEEKIPAAEPAVASSEEDLFDELRKIRNHLNVLEPLTNCSAILPSPSLNTLGGSESPTEYATMRPIRFRTHAEAMNNADFAFAKLMCSSMLIRKLLDHISRRATASRLHDDSPPYFGQDIPGLSEARGYGSDDSEICWLYLLLQIVAGLDPAECARRNVYRRGTAYMLIITALRFDDERLLLFADDFLSRVETSGAPCEDGYTPIHLTRMFVSTLIHEMRQGRTILIAASTHSALASKDAILSREPHVHIMVHGADARGRYFNDAIPLRSSMNDRCA